MNKKLLASLTILIPLAVYAVDEPFPSDWKGIHITPFAQQNFTTEMKNEMNTKRDEERKNGYQYNDNQAARFLLSIKDKATKQIKENKISQYGKFDTNLKESWSEISLAIPFKGISFIDKKDVIGYAAVGSFIKEKGKEGWDGVAEFFISPLGICEYRYMTIVAVQLDEDDLKYKINNKPSSKIVEGSPHSGFFYSIDWYTDNSMSSLDCANKQYKPEMMEQVIKLASRIDSDLHMS